MARLRLPVLQARNDPRGVRFDDLLARVARSESRTDPATRREPQPVPSPRCEHLPRPPTVARRQGNGPQATRLPDAVGAFGLADRFAEDGRPRSSSLAVPSDAVWVADVPDIGNGSAHGETAEEAPRNASSALGDVLADARERGLPLPPPTERPALARAS